MFKFCSEAVVALLFWQTKQNLSYSLNCSIRLWISRFGYVVVLLFTQLQPTLGEFFVYASIHQSSEIHERFHLHVAEQRKAMQRFRWEMCHRHSIPFPFGPPFTLFSCHLRFVVITLPFSTTTIPNCQKTLAQLTMWSRRGLFRRAVEHI